MSAPLFADIPALAIAAVEDIAMPEADRLRAVAVLAIAMSAHEDDGRAAGLPEAEIIEGCRVMGDLQARNIRLMYPAEADRGA